MVKSFSFLGKMNVFRFLICFSLMMTYSHHSKARIAMHVGIIYKKVIGKGFSLSNEKHAIIQVDEREVISLKMKGGYRIELQGLYVRSVKEYGPSGFVRIKGNIFNPEGKIVKTLNEPPLDIYLRMEKKIHYQNNSGEEVELILSPHSV